MKRPDRYVTLALIGIGLTLLMLIALIVAATQPTLRVPALVIVGATILARLPLTFFRRRELVRRIETIKADNGGELPAANLRRVRILLWAGAGVFAVLGVAAMIAAIFVPDRIPLLVFGGAFALGAIVVVVTVRRILT